MQDMTLSLYVYIYIHILSYKYKSCIHVHLIDKPVVTQTDRDVYVVMHVCL